MDLDATMDGAIDAYMAGSMMELDDVHPSRQLNIDFPAIQPIRTNRSSGEHHQASLPPIGSFSGISRDSQDSLNSANPKEQARASPAERGLDRDRFAHRPIKPLPPPRRSRNRYRGARRSEYYLPRDSPRDRSSPSRGDHYSPPRRRQSPTDFDVPPELREEAELAAAMADMDVRVDDRDDRRDRGRNRGNKRRRDGKLEAP